MVGPWNPKCLESLHSRIANHDVLDGNHECGTHVENSCHIRRGKDNRERHLMSLGEIVGVEISRIDPCLIDGVFRGRRVIGLEEFRGNIRLLEGLGFWVHMSRSMIAKKLYFFTVCDR